MMVVIKPAPSKEAAAQEDLEQTATPTSSNFVTALFSKCVGAVGMVLLFVVKNLAMLILQVWLFIEALLSVVMGPIECFVSLVTNPHGVAMFWIILEVFFEVGVSVILAGVSVLMSAILLLEDAFKGPEDGHLGDVSGDTRTKSLFKKVRAKVFASRLRI
ncbi:hypothetical protein C0J52_12467 [Blattella germanica]|nr:hypothetical protein C0J52_12467 [Blattella germanica]